MVIILQNHAKLVILAVIHAMLHLQIVLLATTQKFFIIISVYYSVQLVLIMITPRKIY